MRAFIVYESAWGNTRGVAEAIAAGFPQGVATEVVAVEDAQSLDSLQVDLLLVGAPTHAFGLSRTSTREDAHRRGGEQLSTGVREWIEAADSANLRVATFDTHVRHPNLPGAASRTAAKKLRRLGCTLAADPISFYVDGYEGPVLPGELDRARAWGSELATRLESIRHDT